MSKWFPLKLLIILNNVSQRPGKRGKCDVRHFLFLFMLLQNKDIAVNSCMLLFKLQDKIFRKVIIKYKFCCYPFTFNTEYMCKLLCVIVAHYGIKRCTTGCFLNIRKYSMILNTMRLIILQFFRLLDIVLYSLMSQQ